MAKDWQSRLDRLAASLEASLGDDLVALLLYGSLARPGAPAVGGGSDVNVALIVRDASVAGLRPVAEAVAGWTRAGFPPPLIFSEVEWRDSADVFPLEIEDMREAHRLLRGRDPFSGLQTTAADLRAELEREVRGKLLRLRTEYAAAAPDGKALGALLEASCGTILVLLRGAARLAGRTPPGDAPALVGVMATVAGFDAAAFDWPLARRAGRRVTNLAPFDLAAARYLDAVQRLASWVDASPTG